jgi:hypothetical protein
MLITDSGTSPTDVQALKDFGVRVIIARAKPRGGSQSPDTKARSRFAGAAEEEKQHNTPIPLLVRSVQPR